MMSEKNQPKRQINSRQVPRVPVQGKIQLVISPRMQSAVGLVQKRIEGELTDMSTLGLGMTSGIFLPKGSRIQGQVSSARIFKSRPLRFVGTVMNIGMQSGHRYRVGIKFERIKSHDRGLIQNFIDRESI